MRTLNNGVEAPTETSKLWLKDEPMRLETSMSRFKSYMLVNRKPSMGGVDTPSD